MAGILGQRGRERFDRVAADACKRCAADGAPQCRSIRAPRRSSDLAPSSSSRHGARTSPGVFARWLESERPAWRRADGDRALISADPVPRCRSAPRRRRSRGGGSRSTRAHVGRLTPSEARRSSSTSSSLAAASPAADPEAHGATRRRRSDRRRVAPILQHGTRAPEGHAKVMKRRRRRACRQYTRGDLAQSDRRAPAASAARKGPRRPARRRR